MLAFWNKHIHTINKDLKAGKPVVTSADQTATAPRKDGSPEVDAVTTATFETAVTGMGLHANRTFYLGKHMEEKVKAIEIALANELKERDFYLENARRTQNPIGKKMFEVIASDEDDHYRRLQKIHEVLTAQGSWTEEIPALVDGTAVNAILKDVGLLAEKTASADTNDIEAVKVAIEFESKGYSFYRDLAERAATPAEKDFFSRLADIEKEHLSSLKDTLLFFQDPSTWYEEHEKPHLEG